MNAEEPALERRQDGVSQADIFTSVAAQAGALYRLLVTVASTFLGGTLIFMDNLAPNPSGVSLAFLYTGWAALIGCIILVTFVRADNVRSGQKALEGKYAEAREIDSRNRKQTTAATILLAVGLGSIMIFGAINTTKATSPNEEHPMAEERKNAETTGTDAGRHERRSIPYGSIETPQVIHQQPAPAGDGTSTGDETSTGDTPAVSSDNTGTVSEGSPDSASSQ